MRIQKAGVVLVCAKTTKRFSWKPNTPVVPQRPPKLRYLTH
ncbi:MAG: hypothetical protein ACKODZ_03210 [Verrucomicrobiota bacterium]